MPTEKSSKRRVVFLTGTRADFGKLKPLMQTIQLDLNFELHVFVTGMHMLAKYGSTYQEVENAGLGTVHKFINQNSSDRMDHVLAKTISGLSDYVTEFVPDLLIVHGDRVEALAGAAVGALNNMRVGHVEGGEVSGTIDESIRHAVSKFAHVHFVANQEARARLVQLGEPDRSIHVIGSPDVDLMNSVDLPPLDEARKRYAIDFEPYGIVMFHPVTTELESLSRQARALVEALVASGLNYVVVHPNNDHGTELVWAQLRELGKFPRFKLFPSIRFEHFLTLMKNATVVVGNSSAGVREAPHFGIPAVNVGTRQTNRVKCATVIDCPPDAALILQALQQALALPRVESRLFGKGDSAHLFRAALLGDALWAIPTQKYFVDI